MGCPTRGGLAIRARLSLSFFIFLSLSTSASAPRFIARATPLFECLYIQCDPLVISSSLVIISCRPASRPDCCAIIENCAESFVSRTLRPCHGYESNEDHRPQVGLVNLVLSDKSQDEHFSFPIKYSNISTKSICSL